MFFELDCRVQPSTDAIAYMLATFMGTTIESLEIDLPLSMNAIENIKAFTKVEIIASAILEKMR